MKHTSAFSRRISSPAFTQQHRNIPHRAGCVSLWIKKAIGKIGITEYLKILDVNVTRVSSKYTEPLLLPAGIRKNICFRHIKKTSRCMSNILV